MCVSVKTLGFIKKTNLMYTWREIYAIWKVAKSLSSLSECGSPPRTKRFNQKVFILLWQIAFVFRRICPQLSFDCTVRVMVCCNRWSLSAFCNLHQGDLGVFLSSRLFGTGGRQMCSFYLPVFSCSFFPLTVRTNGDDSIHLMVIVHISKSCHSPLVIPITLLFSPLTSSLTSCEMMK